MVQYSLSSHSFKLVITQPSERAQLDEIANRIYEVWKYSFLVNCPSNLARGTSASLHSLENCEGRLARKMRCKKVALLLSTRDSSSPWARPNRPLFSEFDWNKHRIEANGSGIFSSVDYSPRQPRFDAPPTTRIRNCPIPKRSIKLKEWKLNNLTTVIHCS